MSLHQALVASEYLHEMMLAAEENKVVTTMLYSLQIDFLSHGAAALWLSGRGNDGGNPGPRPESIMAPSAGRIRPTGPARGSLCIYISSNKPST